MPAAWERSSPATDTRLRRSVALKLLPARRHRIQIGCDRFEQEALAAAALNHPNILAVYDIGADEHGTYLVSELLEGHTLRESLLHGALPQRKTLDYAIQIARARRGHEKGIVHRDLKPENVFVTDEGRVKILDFGLAKPTGALDPTVRRHWRHHPRSPPGDLLGTVGYMSPEQVAAPRRSRSDLFAFGAMLYEMLTGHRAFSQGLARRDINAILKEDPPEPPEQTDVALRPISPESFGTAWRRIREARFRSARDLAFALEPLAAEQHPTSTPQPRARRRSRAWLGGIVLAAAAAGIAVPAALRTDSAEPSRQIVRSVLPLDNVLYGGDGIAMSRDGSLLAYAAPVGGTRQLFVWSMASMTARAVPDTDGAIEPFFSYDGQWVGFVAAGKLKKVSVSGGAPQTICAATGRLGASWGPDDTILFTPSITEGIWRVAATGGTPTRVTTPDRSRGEKSHRFAEWLPGANAFIFYTHLIEMPSLDAARIELLDLRSGGRRVLVEGGHGRCIQRRDTLSTSTTTRCTRCPSTPGASRSPVHRCKPCPASGSRRGACAGFIVGGRAADSTRRAASAACSANWSGRIAGRGRPAAELRAEFESPRLSLDGQRLAGEIVGANDNVWIYELARQTWTRLDPDWDTVAPVWAPDGARLAVGYSKPGALNLFWMPIDSRGAAHGFSPRPNLQTPTSWSPDGRYVVYTETSPDHAPRHLDHGRGGAGRANLPADAFRAKAMPSSRQTAAGIAYSFRPSPARPRGLRAQFRRVGRAVEDLNDGGEWADLVARRPRALLSIVGRYPQRPPNCASSASRRAQCICRGLRRCRCSTR